MGVQTGEQLEFLYTILVCTILNIHFCYPIVCPLKEQVKQDQVCEACVDKQYLQKTEQNVCICSATAAIWPRAPAGGGAVGLLLPTGGDGAAACCC